jgi:hypothetical protein
MGRNWMSIVVSDTSSSRRGTSMGPVIETRTLVGPNSVRSCARSEWGVTSCPDCRTIGSGERVCGEVLGEEHGWGSFHTMVRISKGAKIYAGNQNAIGNS